MNFLQQFEYSFGLFSSINLDNVVDKLPLDNTKRRLFAFTKSPIRAIWIPILVEFINWLQKDCKCTSAYFTLRQQRPKLSPVSPSLQRSQTSRSRRKMSLRSVQTIARTNQKWNVLLTVLVTDFGTAAKFKDMKIDERYNVAKKMFFCCLGDNHPAKNCPKKRKCVIDDFEMTNDTFLHYAKKTEINKSAINTEGTKLTSNAESDRGLMPIATVRIFGQEGRLEDTLAVCDTGSTQTC